MKELEAVKGFSKSVERKFEEFENAIIGLSERRVSTYNESSSLTVELLKNWVSTLEKVLIEKDAMIDFLLKQKKENHKSALTETDSFKIKQPVSELWKKPLDKKTESQVKKRESY